MRYRVLQVFTTLQRGGMERQTLNLVRALRASDEYDVQVAALADGPLREELAELGIVDVPVFALRRLYDARAIRQFGRLIAWLRTPRNGFHIVHTHDFYTNTFVQPAAGLIRVPVRIASRRELDVFTLRQRQVERAALRFATTVAANCHALERQLVVEGVPASRIALVPNGIATHQRSAAAGRQFRDEFDIGEDTPLISMLANFHNQRKDFETFTRVASRVTETYPDTVFVIAGAGDSSLVQAQIEACHPRPRLVVTGSLAQIGPLLSATSVLVHAAHSEGLPNAVLEALAYGVPVVATAVGGVPELVRHGDTGFVVGVGESEIAAELVIRLLAEPGTAESLGRRGQAWVRAQYSLDQQANALFSLYSAQLRAHGYMPA